MPTPEQGLRRRTTPRRRSSAARRHAAVAGNEKEEGLRPHRRRLKLHCCRRRSSGSRPPLSFPAFPRSMPPDARLGANGRESRTASPAVLIRALAGGHHRLELHHLPKEVEWTRMGGSQDGEPHRLDLRLPGGIVGFVFFGRLTTVAAVLCYVMERDGEGERGDKKRYCPLTNGCGFGRYTDPVPTPTTSSASSSGVAPLPWPPLPSDSVWKSLGTIGLHLFRF